MSKSVSVDNAYVAYRKALQDFYVLQPEAKEIRTRGLRKVSSADAGQRSQIVLNQSRNFGDALVTALEMDEPDQRELLGLKLLAAAASDLSTASSLLEVQDTSLKSKRFKTRSAFDPVSSLKGILEVPMKSGIYGITKPVTRSIMSNSPGFAKEQLRKTIATFLDEIPDAAASMSKTAAGKVISVGLIPAKQIVSDLADEILEHLPVAASVILQHAASLLAEAVRKIQAALGKGVTDRVKDEVSSWLNNIIEKNDTITKLLKRLYETKRIREEIRIYIDSAPENMSAEGYNQVTKALEDLLSRYSMTKKVLEGVMKVLGFVETPILAAVPWGPLGLYGTYFGVLTYAIFSGGDYLDWYRLEEKAWLDRVSGLRTLVRNSLEKKELARAQTVKKIDPSGMGFNRKFNIKSKSIDLVTKVGKDETGRLFNGVDIGKIQIPIDEYEEMKVFDTDLESPIRGRKIVLTKSPKVSSYAKEIEKGKIPSRKNIKLRVKKTNKLIEEKIRLDVQTPEKVVVGKTFEISVAIRQPESPFPEEPGMPKIVSKPGKTFRETSEEIIKYRVKISAPECEVFNSEATFLLKSGSDSEAHYFQLTAKTEGIISILVQAYQEDGLLAADTHISLTASLEAKLIKSKEDQNMIKSKILFIASSPQNSPNLNLGEEARSIASKIRKAEYRDSFEFVTAWAARPTDLLDEMNRHLPAIVHFSGHGSGEEGLVFTNDLGENQLVTTDALKALFSSVKSNIRLVVLNACFSSIQGKAISRIIECVVGMNKSIGDEAAISFAAYFYSALAYGHSVKDSFSQGKIALMLLNIPEEKTPVLLCRKDIDPSMVYLVPKDEVDYSKIHKINNDIIGNIILKDIDGNTISVNYNDIEKLKPVLQNLSDTQTFEIKQLIGSQNKEILTEIRRIQDRTDERKTTQKASNIQNEFDDFFKELNKMKIEGAKNRIITNYRLLREYEEKIILEDDPRRKMLYQREMEALKTNINTNELELKSIVKSLNYE